MQSTIRTFLACVLFAFFSLAQSETLADAQKLVSDAQLLIQTKGLPTALAEFNAGGKWHTPGLYLVAVAFSGDMLAHSVYPKIVGKNMLEVKDAEGKPFIQEVIRAVKGAGSTVEEFAWANPETKKIDAARMFAAKVAGQDAYLGAVFFK